MTNAVAKTKKIDDVPQDDTQNEVLDRYLSYEYLPCETTGAVRAVYVVDHGKCDAAFLTALYGTVHSIPVSRARFHGLIAERYRTALSRRAVFALCEKAPYFSAREVLTLPQAFFLSLFSMALIAFSCLWPSLVLRYVVCLSSVGFFLGACTRFLLVALGEGNRRRCPRRERSEKNASTSDDDRNFPVYTVLVPLYREVAVLPQLAQALRRIDYPADRLDIKLVVEEDDLETRRLAQALSQDGFFETVVVPASLPRTKPKACNYALRFAVGKYLVIYDAEDRPDSDQLLKAVATFAALPRQVACLQARLRIDNADESLLSALFALDYDIWFTALLPGLDRLRAPMPLGGTSNHFRVDVLRQIGAWDPFNVTEDADLGIRFAQYGYGVSMLDSDTYEEAPTRFSLWLKQRTRWLKGYMQTLLVHLRAPIGLYGRIGLGGISALVMFLGGAVFSALINPLLWFFFLAATFCASKMGHYDVVETLAVVSGSSLFVANAVLAGQILLSARWRKRAHSILYAFGIVVFWMLVSVAAWRALFQLCVRPHFWEKTQHGQSQRRSCEI